MCFFLYFHSPGIFPVYPEGGLDGGPNGPKVVELPVLGLGLGGLLLPIGAKIGLVVELVGLGLVGWVVVEGVA